MKILEILGIKANNEALFVEAFTHSSFSHENNCPDYERLEFLGDKVVDFIVSDYLYKLKDLSEGEMTSIRSNFVCEEAMWTYASSLNFEDYILTSSSFVHKVNKSIVADVFEAFIGAMYIDQGLEKTTSFLTKIILPYVKDSNINFLKDYKSLLQNYVQTSKKSVIYETVDEQGPSHDKTFTCVAIVDGLILGKGVAGSKKAAEQKAAEEALLKCASN